jgi:gluconokinase
MIVVLFGVAGSGKTTIGKKLASALNSAFLEGDALHPPANIAKMSGGTPLTDADRQPWLAAIHDRMLDFERRGKDLVVACSALKRSYRQSLADGVSVTWIFLKASEDVLRSRLESRADHFMKANLLASQFADLEEPPGGIIVDADFAPDIIVAQILRLLSRATDLRIAPNLHQLSSQIAPAIVHVIAASVSASGKCTVALSGGDTPRELYRLLGSTFRQEIPWSQVHIFWGDERYVPHGHPDSNFRLAREVLLDHVPCPARNVHPIPTHFPNPDVAAADYERTLREHFGSSGPTFDLNLLGIAKMDTRRPSSPAQPH